MKLLDKIAEKENFGGSYVSCGGERWSAELLYKTAEEQKCRVEKFPLKFTNFSESPFQGSRLCDFIYHARRIQNADYNIPIIIGPLGGILDGYHRIAHALLDGKTEIKCYRLKEMPEPDGKDD